MTETLDLALFMALGLGIGFIVPLTGAGGLVSVPMLIFMGLPPQTAIATNRMGAVGVWLMGFRQFYKADKVVWRFVPALCVLGIIGGALGASIVVSLSEETLKIIIAMMIFILFGLMLVNTDMGIIRRDVTPRRLGAGFALYLLCCIYRGFYGGGSGAVLNIILMSCMGLTILESKATRALPEIFLSVASLAVFFTKSTLDLSIGIAYTIGTAAGGWWGAHTAIHKGDAWVKRVFMIFAVLMAAKLLYDGLYG